MAGGSNGERQKKKTRPRRLTSPKHSNRRAPMKKAKHFPQGKQEVHPVTGIVYEVSEKGRWRMVRDRGKPLRATPPTKGLHQQTLKSEDCVNRKLAMAQGRSEREAVDECYGNRRRPNKLWSFQRASPKRVSQSSPSGKKSPSSRSSPRSAGRSQRKNKEKKNLIEEEEITIDDETSSGGQFEDEGTEDVTYVTEEETDDTSSSSSSSASSSAADETIGATESSVSAGNDGTQTEEEVEEYEEDDDEEVDDGDEDDDEEYEEEEYGEPLIHPAASLGALRQRGCRGRPSAALKKKLDAGAIEHPEWDPNNCALDTVMTNRFGVWVVNKSPEGGKIWNRLGTRLATPTSIVPGTSEPAVWILNPLVQSASQARPIKLRGLSPVALDGMMFSFRHNGRRLLDPATKAEGFLYGNGAQQMADGVELHPNLDDPSRKRLIAELALPGSPQSAFTIWSQPPSENEVNRLRGRVTSIINDPSLSIEQKVSQLQHLDFSGLLDFHQFPYPSRTIQVYSIIYDGDHSYLWFLPTNN